MRPVARGSTSSNETLSLQYIFTNRGWAWLVMLRLAPAQSPLNTASHTIIVISAVTMIAVKVWSECLVMMVRVVNGGDGRGGGVWSGRSGVLGEML